MDLVYSYIVTIVENDNDMQQKIMINIQRKICRANTDAIYNNLASADDIERQTELIIDNGILKNRPSNQGLD